MESPDGAWSGADRFDVETADADRKARRRLAEATEGDRFAKEDNRSIATLHYGEPEMPEALRSAGAEEGGAAGEGDGPAPAEAGPEAGAAPAGAADPSLPDAFAAAAPSGAAPAPEGVLAIPKGPDDGASDLAPEAPDRQSATPARPAAPAIDLSATGGDAAPTAPERPGEEEPREEPGEPPVEPIGDGGDEDPVGEEPPPATNEGPTAVSLSATDVDENAAGAVIGTVTVADPDAGDTHTLAVSDARFEIVGGQLKLKDGVSLDHEAEPTVTVTVTATDAGGLSKAQSFDIAVADLNEGPTAVSLSASDVDENDAGAAIGTVTVADPDAGDTHTLAVSDARFEIVGGQLKLKDGVSLDHEAEPTVSVTVTATDAGGLSRAQSFDIAVADLNEGPTAVSLSATDVDENAAGAVIGTVTVADPDAGDSHTLQVSDARFEIVGGQLKLKDGVSLDHEAEPTVTVTVTATDAGGLSKAQSFDIAVADLNEGPTAVSLSASDVDENDAGAAIGTVTVADPDAGDTHTLAVSDARFEIVGGQLKLKDGVSLDHEAEPTVSVTVTATDAGGLSRAQSFDIAVADLNEGPTAVSLSATDVDENAAGAVIGTVTVADPDAGDSHTLSVSDARFEIVGGQLKLKDGVSLDHEAEPTVTVTVTATDAGGLSKAQSFDIAVADLNEGPTAVSLSASDVDENDAGAAIGTVTVADPDAGDTHTLAVSDARFEIVGGQLKLKDGVSLDHEAEPTVSVTVTATDAGGLSRAQSFDIAVADLNEGPTAVSLSATDVDENAAGAVIGTVTVADPDAGDTHTLAVSDARFEIVGGQLKLKDGVSLDHEAEPTVTVTVTATDAGGLSKAQSFDIAVADLNEGPTAVSLSASDVDENDAGAAIGTVTVADPDAGDTHTLAVSDARFEIVGGQLKLKDGVSLDHEAEPTVTVTVTATDAGGLSKAQSFDIAVADLNEGPTAVSLSASDVDENDAGAAIGTVTVADPDAGDTHTLAVSDARFEIVGGQLKLKDGVSLDHEAEPTVTVTVTATDAGGLSKAQSFDIAVADLNEGPTAVSLSASDVDENDAGAAIGTVTVADPDAGDTHTLAVSDARFEIVGGQLKLKDGVSLDHEAEPTVSVTVTATDAGGLSRAQSFDIAVADLNEGPTAVSLSATDVDENAAGAVIGTVTVADPDAGDSHTLSVSDARFEIVGGQLKLKDGVSLDHEAEPTVTVTVTATDAGGLSKAQSFDIAVADLNEGPTAVSLSASDVDENDAGAAIGTVTVADPDAGDTHTLAVSDARFEIVGGQLKLKDGVSLDHEAEPTVSVTVTATDAGGLSRAQSFDIAVADLNEGPTAVSLSATDVDENAAGAVIGTVTVADPDAGDTHTLAVSDARFEIVGGQLKLKDGVSLDHEAEPTVTVTVTATDAGGLSKAQSFDIAVADLNEGPTAVSLSASDVDENDAGAAIGTVTVADPDAGDTHTLAVSDARFEIVGGQLKLKDGVSLDHEAEPTVSVTVTATDAGGLSRAQSFDIAVADLNEGPTAVSLSATDVDENAAGAVIGTVTVADPDAGDSHTLQVSDARFEIVGGQLKLKDGVSLDHEAEPTVSVTVTATDAGGLSRAQSFDIAVADLNEGPTAVSLSATDVDENAAGAVIGTVTVADPDAGDTHTLAVSDARFEIVGGQLKLKDGVSLDHEAEPTVTVTVTATDAGGLSKAQSFDIAVADLNEGPTAVSLSASDVDENDAGAAIGTVTVADPDAGDTHTLAVSDARFEIVGGQLKLKDGVSLDHEAEPTVTVTVTATDAGGLSKAQSFDIAVADLNEGPTAVSLSASDVDENDAGAAIGTVTVADPDAGDTHTLAVSDARFEIVGGQLKLKDGVSLDHEAEPTVSVTVTATDAGGLSRAQSFDIAVADLNEGPTAVSLSATDVDENAAGAVIGTVTVADPDAGDSHTLQVSDARFEIVGGQLKLKDGVSLDHEAEPTVTVTVTATDAGGLSKAQSFDIAVADLNEGPTAVSLSASDVDENDAGAAIGTVTVADPDAGDTHTLAVSDARFEIVGGQLKLKDGVSLDHEAEPTVSVTVTATDAGGLSRAQSFDIAVADLNEGPTAVSLSATDVDENAAGAVIGTVTVADPDAGDSHTLQVSDARFEIVGGQLKLKDGVSLDHEAEPTVTVTVTATDAGGLSKAQSFDIAVADLNEGPTAVSLSASDVDENDAGAAIGTVTVADPDAGDTHTLAVSDARFEIVGGQLKLKDGVSLDHEAEPTVSVTVTATDAGGLSRAQSFDIAVADLNEGPTAVSLSATDVDENAAGAVIGTVTVADPDAGDSHTLQVSDARFEIVGGQLKLKDGVSLDHEAEPTVTVTVTATDAGGLSKAQSFDIAVADLNEGPTAVSLSATDVDENDAGAVIGTVTVADPDAGDTHTLAVSDARFEIVGGQLKLKDGVSLDHEAEPTVSVTVTATDAGGLSRAQSFDIAVADLNEGPTAVSLSATDVDENAAGAVIGTVTVADPDAGDTHTLAVSDARFEIVGGQLKLKDGVSLDHEAEPTVSVTVTATDAGGLSRAQSFDIAVADLNEGPTAVSLSATDVDENDAGAVIGTVTVADPDAGDSHTLSVSDARFEIVGGQLKLKDGVSLSYEEGETVSVTVTATDVGGLSRAQSFDIAVGDVAETIFLTSGDDHFTDTGVAEIAIHGADGDDTIIAHEDGGVIRGEGGADSLVGGAGQDSLDGGEGDDTLEGHAPTLTRQSFNWSALPDPNDGGQIDHGDDLTAGSVQNTGLVEVSVSIRAVGGTPDVDYESGFTQNVAGIDSGGETINPNSAAEIDYAGATAGSSVVTFDFASAADGVSDEVRNVSFRINDIDRRDGTDTVTIKAYDAFGNEIAVTLTGGSDVTLTDTDGVAGADTATARAGVGDSIPNEARSSLLVEVAGPVARIEIHHALDASNLGGVRVTDVFFDAVTPHVDGAGDTLVGGAGDDLILGAAGGDLIEAGDGSDRIDGGAGNDTILYGDGDDTVMGGGGDDAIDDVTGARFAGATYIDGGSGNDTIWSGDGDGTVLGGDGNDLIDGEHGDDVIEGGAGDDTIIGDLGDDTLSGGDGDDLFIQTDGFGDDQIDGGEGADTIDASAVTDAVTLTVSGAGEGTLSIGGVEGGPALADNVIETPGAQFEFFLLDKTAWTDPARMLASNSSSGDASAGQMIAFNGYNGVKAGIQQTLLEDGASSLAQAVTINGQTFAAGADIELDYGFIVADANGIQYFVGKVDLGGGGQYDASVITAGWNPATGEWVDPPAPGTVLTLLNLDNVTGTPWSGSHSAGKISSSGFDPYSNDAQLGPSVTAPVVEAATTPAEPIMSASFQSVEAFRLGAGDDVADASAATVDLVIEGRGGSDTIHGGSGNDLIDAGDGRIDSVEATGVRSPTFNVFRLGNFGDLDPDESNGASENAAAMLGTYGSEDNPLFLHLTRATGNDANNNGRIEDNDWNRADAEVETYTIDGQTVKLDSGQAYNATATFTDGTSGSFLAIVVQLQNGETYLFPAFNNPQDSVLLTMKPIASVALNSVALDDGFPGTMRFDTDFKTMAGNEAHGGAGDDTIIGGAGADTLTGGAGNDSITGGGGADIAVFTGNRSDYTIVDLGDGAYRITDNRANGAANEGTDTVSGVEIFRFANGDVAELDLITPRLRLIGTGANETLTGGASNDTIEGRGGADRLVGGEGDDRILGGTSQDTILGGDGADTIIGNGGHDSIDAGAGHDSVTTTSGNDTISGGAGDDVIISNGGADSVLGGEGNDFLSLGLGNDRAWGEAGNDTIRGEGGHDTIDGGAGDDSIDAGADNDLATGGEGNDTLIGGTGDDTMTGDAGDDSLTGGDGADSLTAGDGNDTIEGGAGNDRLFGEAGDDVIDAGDGADSITGGAGDDTISGGGGDDRAYWSQPRSEFRIFYDAKAQTFTIRDLDEAGVDEGRDTVSGVEFFVFGGVEYTAAQMIAEAARQETEGAGFEINLAGGGFIIEYFDLGAGVNSVSDIDWNAEPVHKEAREALDFVEDVGPAFHAEATVRFDNLAGGHWQRIFDYGNGPASDNIWLGQAGNSNSMKFEVFDGSTGYSITANGVIVQGETATWGAQISDDGLMQILKNGVVVAEGHGIVPPDVERANKLVGESNWEWDTPLIGEVVSITVDEDGYDHYAALSGGFNDAVDADTFALRATGSVTVEEAGVYEFRLGSDDGAVLYVNGEEVASRDAPNSFGQVTGSITLAPGEHEIEVRYFDNFHSNGLSLEWKAPGEAEFSLLRADGGLETVEASPLTLDLDVDPGGWTVSGVSLSGLPDGTILMSGDDVAVSGADPLDVTGWNLEHLEITPPAGFVGTISLEVSVDGLDSGGAAAERLSVFEIEVAPDPEAAAGPEAGGGGEAGWVDAADGGADPSAGGDVMAEDVDFSSDQGVEGPGFYSHETQDP